MLALIRLMLKVGPGALLILGIGLFQALWACDVIPYHYDKQNSDSAMVGGSMADATVQSGGHNVGVYYYDTLSGRSTLVESYLDPFVSTWALNPGNIYQSNASFDGIGINARDDGSSIECVNPPPIPLPLVSVTASVPRQISRIGGYYYRAIGVGGGGDGGGVNTIRPVATVQGDSDYTCEKMEEHRLADANALAKLHVRRARRGNDFIVRMADGRQEHWTYRCVGPGCGPTVLRPSPRVSPCSDT